MKLTKCCQLNGQTMSSKSISALDFFLFNVNCPFLGCLALAVGDKGWKFGSVSASLLPWMTSGPSKSWREIASLNHILKAYALPWCGVINVVWAESWKEGWRGCQQESLPWIFAHAPGELHGLLILGGWARTPRGPRVGATPSPYKQMCVVS